MNLLKKAMMAAILTTCFTQLAWAQTVEDVSMDMDARTVKVLMNL